MLRSWWWQFLLVITLVSLTVVLINSYFELVGQGIDERSQMVTREVALNLRTDIESSVKALLTLGEINIDDFDGPHHDYVGTAMTLLKNYPNLYSVNWVDEKGVIRRVYPYEQNKAALGHNIITERKKEAVFERSRLHHTPVLGTKIRTFQGIDAAAISVPVYDRRNVLRGWINGVLDLETLLRHALGSRSESLSAKLSWRSDPSSTFAVNEGPMSHVTRIQFPLLDQDLILDVGLTSPEASPSSLKFWMLTVGLMLDTMVAVLLFSLKISLDRVVALNRRLRLKNALVSSLAHDMGTPLTVLSIGIERLKTHPEEIGTRERLFKSSQALLRMLKSVKLIHAMETGDLKVRAEPVNLTAAVTSALEQVEVLAREKAITFVNQVPARLPAILAEASTLGQNVIPNILTNAIKFSPASSNVRLSTVVSATHVQLIIEDPGFGIPPEKLKPLLDGNPSGSLDGTDGEKGYGLGMVQVRTFMDVYEGSFDIQSKVGPSDHGTRVTLTFKRAAHGES